jgi:SAM-dependent methyltransferase
MNVPDGLWTHHSPEALRRLYDDWAERYDADMRAGGMLGPQRLVGMLDRLLPERGTRVADFGCGTGLAGEALAGAGFHDLHGQDISEGMLAVARRKDVYASLACNEPEAPIAFPPGTRAVISSGSISIGAGPASLLRDVGEAMARNAILLVTFNDDTLRDAGYMTALAEAQISGLFRLELAEYGPQLPALNRGATAYALRRL